MALAEIMDIADEGLNDDEAINNCLTVANSNLADSVDRRVGLVVALSGGTLSLDSPKGLISSLKEREEAIRIQRKVLEKTLIRIKETTIKLMEEFNCEVIKGAHGEFKLQGGVASLVCDLPLYSRSYSSLIAPADSIGVPSEYLIYEQIATVNKEIIKKDLLNGVQLPWARLQYNKQIRMKHVLALR